MPVAWLINFTDADGMTAPDGSAMVPLTSPVAVWPSAEVAVTSNTNSSDPTVFLKELMTPSMNQRNVRSGPFPRGFSVGVSSVSHAPFDPGVVRLHRRARSPYACLLESRRASGRAVDLRSSNLLAAP